MTAHIPVATRVALSLPPADPSPWMADMAQLDEPEPVDPPAELLLGLAVWGPLLALSALWAGFLIWLIAKGLANAAAVAEQFAHGMGAW